MIFRNPTILDVSNEAILTSSMCRVRDVADINLSALEKMVFSSNLPYTSRIAIY